MLIINADDFGLNDSCTRAIIEAFDRGLITDTTMVANGEAFEFAVKEAKGALQGHVGIHFNLTEGNPLTKDIAEFPEFCTDGAFNKRISRYKPHGRKVKRAVRKELDAQLSRLIDAGLTITRADSHHHIHTAPWIASIVADVCKAYGVKTIRLHRNIGAISKPKKMLKGLYNRWLRKRFETTDYFGAPEDISSYRPNGSIELMVHPDYSADGVLIDRLADMPLERYLSPIA